MQLEKQSARVRFDFLRDGGCFANSLCAARACGLGAMASGLCYLHLVDNLRIYDMTAFLFAKEMYFGISFIESTWPRYTKSNKAAATIESIMIICAGNEITRHYRGL